MKLDWLVVTAVVISLSTGVSLPTVDAHEVCYGKYGCFNDLPPYANDLTPLPLAPEMMGTKFRLFSRFTSMDDGDILEVFNPDSLEHFQSGGQTVLIIHGFIENGLKQWIKDLKEALLTKQNISNVISVDWARGASPYQTYPQAAANTRVIGAQVEELLVWLCSVRNLTASDFHIIGSSLGAHVAGFAGRRLRQNGLLLRRITGLDPAGPGFSEVDPVLRLDPSDASFVDVIHTDIGGSLVMAAFGIAKPCGHLDFYPNGGDNQPNCKTTFYNAVRSVFGGRIEKVLGCSHNRAIYLFLHSIHGSCPLLSFPCASWGAFQRGQCRRCRGDCVEMGMNSEQHQHKTGSYYLETGGREPFCLVKYKVTVYSSASSRQFFSSFFKPKIKMQILGDSGNSEVVEIDKADEAEISFSLRSPPLELMKAVRLWYRGAIKKTFYKIKIVPVEDGYGEFCSQVDATLNRGFYYRSTVSPLTKEC